MTPPLPNDKPSGVDLTLHLRLVYWVADKIAKQYGGKREDYLGAGYIALVNAAKTYDPSKGKFSTHAVRALRWKIRESVYLDRGFKRGRGNTSFRPPHKRLYEDTRTTSIPERLVLEDFPLWYMLTDRQRTVLRLRFIEEMTVKQIAELLDVATGTVSMDTTTALRRLTST